jgi:hypothetical protein
VTPAPSTVAKTQTHCLKFIRIRIRLSSSFVLIDRI